MDRLRHEWNEFLAFLRNLPGPIGTMTGPSMVAAVEAQEAFIYPVFAEVMGEDEGTPAVVDVSGIPEDTDYENWSERTRRDANMTALRALRALGGQPAMGDVARALRAYSGWGGIETGKIPLDASALSPELLATLQAHRDWKPGDIIPPRIFGLRHQYFTPLPLCHAVWRLVNRIRDEVGLPVRSALEPSAGVGRFLRTSSVRDDLWTAIDMDPDLAAILTALHPEARVHTSAFEHWYTHTGSVERFDLVIGNPPYADRSRTDRQMDGYEFDRAEDYFLDRATSVLAPGGVLAFVTMMSQLTGETRAPLRAAMLRRAHLAGAVALPADLFPGASVQTMVLVLVGRPEAQRESHSFTDHERAIIAGRYWGDVVQETDNVIGRWVKGRFADQMILKGDFDPAQVVNATLQALPEGFADAVRADRERAVEPIRTDVLVPTPGRRLTRRRGAAPLPTASVMAATAASADVAAVALALVYRLGRFSTLQETDPSLAEVGRPELARDLTTFGVRYGNPHGVETITRDPGMVPLLEAIQVDGSLSPVFTAPIATRADESLPADASVADVVVHYSKWRGLCTVADLRRHGFRDAQSEILADNALAIGFQVDGEPVYFRLDDYLTGDLYTRMDNVDAALSGSPDPAFQERLLYQKRALLDTLQTTVISDVEDLTPRSGIVSVECLTDYVRMRFERSKPVEGSSPTFTLAVVKGLLQFDLAEDQPGWMAHEGMGAERVAFITQLMGYWNRQELVKDVEGAAKRKRRSEDGATVGTRMAADKELEADFQAWVTSSEKWRQVIEDAYNRAYRSFRARIYDTAPVPITRWDAGAISLRAHQNAGIRRVTDRKSGVFAWAVGYGKTAGGIGTIAHWRQEGRASRPLVVVPNSLVPNWLREVRRALPDYRVATIGMTVDPTAPKGKQARLDDEDTRRMKWQRFAAGDYDLVICPYSWFTLDVDVKPETQDKVLSKIFWLQRELGISEEENELTRGKIEEAQAAIKEIREPVREGRDRGFWKRKQQAEALTKLEAGDTTGMPPYDLREARNAQERIKKLEADIAKWEKKLEKPSDRLLDEIRAEIDEATEDIQKQVGKGPVVWWDDLGVDCLVVDEAHNFKNLWAAGDRYGTNIEFMGSQSGNERTVRSWDLFIKCQELLERTEDQGVLLMTGTPIKNSPMEVYNLLSYCSRRIWDDRQIRSAEEFVDRFCELKERTSIDKIKGGFKHTLIVSAFKNLDELRSLMDAYVDKRMDPLPDVRVPEGKRDPTAEVPLDALQTRLIRGARHIIMAMIAEAKEALKEAGEYSMFKAKKVGGTFALRQMDIMSKIALDPRMLLSDKVETQALLDSGKVDDEDKIKSLETRIEILERLRGYGLDEVEGTYTAETPPAKYRRLAEKIVEDGLVQNAKGNVIGAGCGHVAFCDYNEPHEWIREAVHTLTGIPIKRIALVNNKTAKKPDQRQAIADAFNGSDEETVDGVVISPAKEPKYDLVIGNSAIMAEGFNLQRRTCSVHHLTIPWEPATITQRNGRGVRQGNQNDEVWIRYYVSPRSFDAIKLNEVLGKLGWQKSLFDETTRSITNPAVESELDREEQMILATSEAPEEDLAEYREKKSLMQGAETEEQKKNYARRFVSVVYQYDKARHVTDPVRREAEFARGDQMARGLKLVPDALFPIKEALPTARLVRILYIPARGTYVYETMRGTRTFEVWRDRKHEILEAQFEITDVDPSGNRVRYRHFGSGRLQSATGTDQINEFLDSIRTFGPATLVTWNADLDRQQILNEGVLSADIPSFDPTLALTLEADLLKSALGRAERITRGAANGYDDRWSAAHEVARVEGSDRWDSAVPLYRVDFPETVALLSGSEVKAILQGSRGLGSPYATLLNEWRYLIPQNKTSWSRFLAAFRWGKLLEMTHEDNKLGLKPDRIDYRGTAKYETLARNWFNNYIAESVLKQARDVAGR